MAAPHQGLISKAASTAPPEPAGSQVFRPAPSPVERIDDLRRELNFLVLHYLHSSPEWKGAADAFGSALEQNRNLPPRLTWEGPLDASYSFLVDKYRDLPRSHLLFLLCELLKMKQDLRLQQIPPQLHCKIAPVTTVLAPVDAFTRRTQLSSVTRLVSPALAGSANCNYASILCVRQTGSRLSSRAVRAPLLYQRFKKLKNLRGHMSAVYCVLFDRSGRRVITGSDDKLVKVWSTETGFLLATLKGHDGDITDMAVNMENTYLATASNDNFIRIWSLVDFSAKAVLIGHNDGITSLGFAPYLSLAPNAMLVSTSMDGTIRLWPVSRFEQPTVDAIVIDGRGLGLNEPAPAASPLPPERLLASVDSLPPSQEPVAADAPAPAPGLGLYNILCGGFSRNGTHYVIGGSDNIVRIWNLEPLLLDLDRRAPELLRGHTASITSASFAHTHDAILSGSLDGTARVWRYDPNVPQDIYGRKKCSSPWRDIVLSVKRQLVPGGRRQAQLRLTFATWSLTDTFAITADSEGTIKLWDPRSGELIRAMSEHQREVYTIECHPQDPNIILSAGYDTAVCLWDLATGHCISKFFTDNALVDGKWASSGLWYAVSDDQGTMTLFGTGDKAHYDNAPTEQFFPWDFSPIVQDGNHYAIDERTQQPHHLLPRTVLCDVLGRPHSVTPPTVATTQLTEEELARERRRLVDLSMQSFGEDWPMYRRRRRTTMTSDDEEEEAERRARARREQRNRGRSRRPASEGRPTRQSRGSDSEFSDDSEESDENDEEDADSQADYNDNRAVRRHRTRSSQLSSDEGSPPPPPHDGATSITDRARRHQARAGVTAVTEAAASPSDEEHSKAQWQDDSEHDEAEDLPPVPPPLWATVTEQVPNYYVPQVGDIVLYFRIGHRMALRDHMHKNPDQVEKRLLPARYDGAQFRVEFIDFQMRRGRATRRNKGTCGFAVITLVPLPTPADSPTLSVTLYDGSKTPDFLVLQSRFLTATDGRFKAGGRVSMWYPNESIIYHGTILHNEFPPPIRPMVYDTRLVRAWDSLHLQWDNDDPEHVNPWEVEEAYAAPFSASAATPPSSASSAASQPTPAPAAGAESLLRTQAAVTTENAGASAGLPGAVHRTATPVETINLEDTAMIVRAIEATMQVEAAVPFRQPVDLQHVPTYCELISYPVDLGTMLQRVKNRYYRRLNSLLFELDLMLHNCERFNGPDSDYTRSCMVVRNHLVAALQGTDCYINRRSGNVALIVEETLDDPDDIAEDISIGGNEDLKLTADDELLLIPEDATERAEPKKRLKTLAQQEASHQISPPTSLTRSSSNVNNRLRSGRAVVPTETNSRQHSRVAKMAALNTIADVLSDGEKSDEPPKAETQLPQVALPALPTDSQAAAPASNTVPSATSDHGTAAPPTSTSNRSRDRSQPPKRKRTKQDSEDEAEFVADGGSDPEEPGSGSSSDSDSLALLRHNKSHARAEVSSDFDDDEDSESRAPRRSRNKREQTRDRSRRKQQKRATSPPEARPVRKTQRPNYRVMDEPESLSLDELRKAHKQAISSPLKPPTRRTAPPTPASSSSTPAEEQSEEPLRKTLRIRIKKS